MNFPDSSSGSDPRKPKKKEIQLQGPRPPQLRVSHESHKIKKPPQHPHLLPPPGRPPIPPAVHQRQQPMIIYAISPKAIHVEESNFMSVVQRLTGRSSSSIDSEAHGGGDLSPAARLASIEKASSPSERQRVIDANDVMDMLEVTVEVGPAPGILSPSPATLPPIPMGYFSPVTEPQTLSFLYELSPYWQHATNFMASPSALLPAHLSSPIHSPDIFNNLFHF